MNICTVRDCYNLQHPGFLLCRRHRKARRLNGSPIARYIHKKELHGHRRSVRRIARRKTSRVQWITAVEAMKDILIPGIEPSRHRSKRWHTWNELRRLNLNYRRVRGNYNDRRYPVLRSYGLHEDAVEYATALFLYSYASPHRLHDGAHLTQQIGNTLLRLAPLRSIRHPVANKPPLPRWPSNVWTTKSWKPGAWAARHIGQRVRERLVPWFVHVLQQIEYPTTGD